MNALAKTIKLAPPPWTQAEAIALCREVEAIAPDYGCHVALTGGCLYKDGERKDLDLLFYRIRQEPEIDKPGLFLALESIGITELQGFGWVHKADYRGRSIDCFFPEEDGEYPTREDEPDDGGLFDFDPFAETPPPAVPEHGSEVGIGQSQEAGQASEYPNSPLPKEA